MKVFSAATVGGVLLVAGAAIALAGPAGSSPQAVNIKLTEMKVLAAPRSVSAGDVTFVARNLGTVEHELVVVRSSRPLAVKGYKAAEPEGATIGEIEDIEPGKTKRATLSLKPGKYLLICNIVGHYQLGMTSTLTVR